MLEIAKAKSCGARKYTAIVTEIVANSWGTVWMQIGDDMIPYTTLSKELFLPAMHGDFV